MKLILIIVFSFLSISLNAGDYNRPSKEYEAMALKEYRWIHDNTECLLYINTSEDAESVLPRNALERYFKLKMRNYVKDISLANPTNGNLSANYLSLNLELHEYNDQLLIYYGLITFQLMASVQSSSQPIVDIYKLTIPIAGSDQQIVRFIKDNIDVLVELYAEDYYYIEDLIKAQAKSK